MKNSIFVVSNLVAQRGIVLFFALIALVAMSLAAVALIRSVDTNSLIAGNLAFKQSTLLSADRGVESAITWASGNASALSANSVANGYYATSNADARTLVDASGFADGADSEGNQISYIVQRMCSVVGTPSDANCLYGPETDKDGCLKQFLPDPPPPGFCKTLPNPAYRVTARVQGPKNTVSYIQAFVY